MPGDLLTLGPEDGGRTVTVHPGDRIVLRLPENPTTGHRWNGAFPDVLRVTRDANDPAEDAPGAGGARVIELTAERSGDGEVALRRARAWDPPAAGDPEFRLRVTVD
jgi:inhibitor of cysteine peptidase